MTDAEIIAAWKDESQRSYAFSMLVRSYGEKLYWVIRRMVIVHDDADDILQEVWIKVYKALETFRSDSQLYTWLYRIAANESLQWLKKKKRKSALSLSDSDLKLEEKIAYYPSLEGDEVQVKVQKAIAALPDKQRLVFNMRYYDETPYEEMSNMLGTSVGALKASYHHAVKKVEAYVLKHD